MSPDPSAHHLISHTGEPGSSHYPPYPQRSGSISLAPLYSGVAGTPGTPHSVLSRSGSMTSLSASIASHPPVLNSPTSMSQMVPSPSSLTHSHFPGSPLSASPAPSLRGPGSPPVPGSFVQHRRSMSASYGSSPLSHHVDMPASLVVAHQMGSAPLRSPHVGRATRSSNRRSVTFSGFPMVADDSGVNNRYGDSQHDMSNHHHLSYSMARAGSVGLDGTSQSPYHSAGPYMGTYTPSNNPLASSTSSTSSTRPPLTENSMPPSPRSLADAGYGHPMMRYVEPSRLGQLHTSASGLGEPAIADYGSEEHRQEGHIIGEPRLMLREVEQVKHMMPSSGPPTANVI